jgi:hypothetical protein
MMLFAVTNLFDLLNPTKTLGLRFFAEAIIFRGIAGYNAHPRSRGPQLYRFARNEGIDMDELRAQLRKMTDEDLVRFGKAARFIY